MSAPIPMQNLNGNNTTTNLNNRAAELHQKRVEYAHHKWNPFPPFTHPAVKAISTIVILFLLAVFATYVVFLSLTYARDKDSPKLALKTLNKERRPVEFPAVTVCNLFDYGPDYAANVDPTYVRPQMVLAGCRYTDSNYTDSSDKFEDCLNSTVFKDTWEDGSFKPCWTFNLKSKNLPVPYKAKRNDFTNALELYFNTDSLVDAISVSLHEAKDAPTVDNLFVPHTFSNHNQLTVIGLQKVETKTINGSKAVTWECNASHMTTLQSVNVSNILLFYQDLTILEYKEAYSYSTVSFIGDIAAGFEILLGLSFFKVYILILALWILTRNSVVY